MSEGKGGLKIKKPSFKAVIIILILALLCAAAFCVTRYDLLGNIGEGKKIEFKELEDKKIPQNIEREIIPEYRELERALGCFLDEKVYVVVTRGEKPTAGYDVFIKEMRLEEKDGKSNLKVYAVFVEPEKDVAVSQVSTFPYTVAIAELDVLPDTIELISEYDD